MSDVVLGGSYDELIILGTKQVPQDVEAAHFAVAAAVTTRPSVTLHVTLGAASAEISCTAGTFNFV